MWEWRQDACFCGVLTEEFDGADAVGVEDVVDVRGEIVADGCRRKGDAWRPLFDEIFNIQEAVIAGGFKVFNKLSRRDGEVAERFGAYSPYGGNPWKIGACVPL